MNNNQPVAYSRLVDVFHQVERLPGQQGVDAHLYCVFIRGTAPTRSRGTDLFMNLKLFDPLSNGGPQEVELLMFSDKRHLLPYLLCNNEPGVPPGSGLVSGDILRLNAVTCQLYQGCKQQLKLKVGAKGYSYKQWAAFREVPESEDQAYIPFASSSNTCLRSEQDMQELDHIRAWLAQARAANPGPSHSGVAPPIGPWSGGNGFGPLHMGPPFQQPPPFLNPWGVPAQSGSFYPPPNGPHSGGAAGRSSGAYAGALPPQPQPPRAALSGGATHSVGNPAAAGGRVTRGAASRAASSGPPGVDRAESATSPPAAPGGTARETATTAAAPHPRVTTDGIAEAHVRMVGTKDQHKQQPPDGEITSHKSNNVLNVPKAAGGAITATQANETLDAAVRAAAAAEAALVSAAQGGVSGQAQGQGTGAMDVDMPGQEGQGEAAAGHMDADAQDFDPDVLNLLACPAPHGEPRHTHLGQIVDRCHSTPPSLIDVCVQVVACDRRPDSIGAGLAAVLYIWDGKDTPITNEEASTLPAVPPGSFQAATDITTHRRPLPLPPGSQPHNSNNNNANSGAQKRPPKTVKRSGAQSATDSGMDCQADADQELSVNPVIPTFGSILPVLVPLDIPVSSLPAVGASWNKIRKLSVFLCHGQPQGLWLPCTKPKPTGVTEPPIVQQATARLKSLMNPGPPVPPNTLPSVTRILPGHENVPLVQIRQLLSNCHRKPLCGPWRVRAMLTKYHPQYTTSAVLAHAQAPMLTIDDCTHGLTLMFKVRLEDATGELEAVLVGKQALTFINQCTNLHGTSGVDAAAALAMGLRAALDAASPPADASEDGADRIGPGTEAPESWGEYCIRAVYSDVARHRETMVFRVIDTEVLQERA